MKSGLTYSLLCHFLEQCAPLTRHAASRAIQRGISDSEIELVWHHGRPTWNDRGIILTLTGVDRPAEVSVALWSSARFVVLVENGGLIVTLWREGGRS